MVGRAAANNIVQATTKINVVIIFLCAKAIGIPMRCGTIVYIERKPKDPCCICVEKYFHFRLFLLFFFLFHSLFIGYVVISIRDVVLYRRQVLFIYFIYFFVIITMKVYNRKTTNSIILFSFVCELNFFWFLEYK